jgi:hypothetical protein
MSEKEAGTAEGRTAANFIVGFEVWQGGNGLKINKFCANVK